MRRNTQRKISIKRKRKSKTTIKRVKFYQSTIYYIMFKINFKNEFVNVQDIYVYVLILK